MLHADEPAMIYRPVSTATAAAAWGTAITAGGTANTYGSWTQIHAGFTYTVRQLIVTLNSGSTSAATRNSYVDIGIGPDAANVTAIAPYLMGSHAGAMNASLGRVYELPIYIPANTPVWARSQDTTASGTIRVNIIASGGVKSGLRWPVCSRMEAVGTLTTATTQGIAITPGASGAQGAWTQAIASSASEYVGLMVVGLGQVDTTMGGLSIVLGVGYGTGGAETLLSDCACMAFNTSAEISGSISWPIWKPIPAGQRLVVRASCSGTADTSSSFILYGMVR